MLKEKIDALLKSYKEKGEATQKLLDKTDFSAADAESVKTLNTERETIKFQLEAGKAAAELNAFENTPGEILPHGTAQGAETDFQKYAKSLKDTTVLGMTRAGHTDLEFGENGMLKHLIENGAGIFGEKAWGGIQSNTYKHSFTKYLRKGRSGLSTEELKDIELGIDEQGGYLAPPEWIARLISREPTPTRLAGQVTNMSTSRTAIVMPKVNYSADDIYATGFRPTWTGEQPTDTPIPEHRVDDSKLFGTTRIDVFTLMLSGYLTRDMIEDSAFDIQGWVQGKFSETIDLTKDNMILNGSGANQPLGIFPSSALADPYEAIKTINSGDAAKLTPDGLTNIVYDLPEQYDMNARFVFSKTDGGKSIAKLKDTQNRYLFSDTMGNQGLATARPSTLLGYPFNYSGFCPNIAANSTPLAFGDLRGYCLLNRIGLSIQVLLEKYAERNAIGIVGRIRFGGKPLEPWRMRVQRIAA